MLFKEWKELNMYFAALMGTWKILLLPNVDHMEHACAGQTAVIKVHVTSAHLDWDGYCQAHRRENPKPKQRERDVLQTRRGRLMFPLKLLWWHASVTLKDTCTTVELQMFCGYTHNLTLLLEGYSHQKSTKQEHEDKVSCASPERALLQHTTVSVPETK